MRRLVFALFLTPLLMTAGCLGATTETEPPAKVQSLGEAPWWEVGEWWDVEITRTRGLSENVRIVHFWNDSETHHFWIGPGDRDRALDMALHDNNPLFGRIHWGILTPHERGIHAHGMYTFPVKVGDQFGGLMFDREWSIEVKNGAREGQLLFEGKSTDDSTIRYDYLAENNWFSFIEIKDRDGETEVRFDVKAHGTDATGTYWFLRGRDYYEATNPAVTQDTFQVKEENMPHKSLAIEIKGRASGPLRIDFLDPDNRVQHSETLTAGDVSKIVEVPTPKIGPWTVRYTGTGSLEGTVEAVGILEYTRTL